MITEKEISIFLNKDVKSPIRIGDLRSLNIDQDSFISYFKPFFNELEDDVYLVKEKQITFLKRAFPGQVNNIEKAHKDYFENKITLEVFYPLIERLSITQKEEFDVLSFVTRKRNISTFEVEIWDNEIFVERIAKVGFKQNVNDFRVWERTFKEATKKAVEHELFYELLKKITILVKEIHPTLRKLQITSHFMRTIAREAIKGENAPEGIHEDGAQYIMSALVINRTNIHGAESQIYEKTSLDHKKLLFKKVLNAGEFAFQADTGEEYTFGNDLWHYVTPIEPLDKDKIGVRDIIGFDIDVLH